MTKTRAYVTPDMSPSGVIAITITYTEGDEAWVWIVRGAIAALLRDYAWVQKTTGITVEQAVEDAHTYLEIG